MVVSALESGSDEFLAHLFQEGQLISWLTSAPEAITPKSRPNDDRAGAVVGVMLRLGLGCLTQGHHAQARPSDAWASAVLWLPPQITAEKKANTAGAHGATCPALLNKGEICKLNGRG